MRTQSSLCRHHILISFSRRFSSAGLDGLSNGGLNAAGGVNHVTPNHPLLMGRQPGADNASGTAVGTTARTGTRTMQRHRGGRLQGYIQLNRAAAGGGGGGGGGGGQNPSAPQVLQNFLGATNPQEIISQGLRRGTPLLVDFGFAILDSLESELPEVDGSGLMIGGRAALSTIPAALARWNEESRVIDGDSMHDCVTALKPDILEVIERVREEELAERRSKKKKQQEQQEEEEAKKKKEEEEEAEKKRKEDELKYAQDAAAVAAAAQEAAVAMDDALVGISAAASSSPAVAATAATTTNPTPVSSSITTTTVADGAVTITTTTTSIPPQQQQHAHAPPPPIGGSNSSSTAASMVPLVPPPNLPQQSTISQTAAQLAEGLSAAISSRLTNFPSSSPNPVTTAAPGAGLVSPFPTSGALGSLWTQPPTAPGGVEISQSSAASSAGAAASEMFQNLMSEFGNSSGVSAGPSGGSGAPSTATTASLPSNSSSNLPRPSSSSTVPSSGAADQLPAALAPLSPSPEQQLQQQQLQQSSSTQPEAASRSEDVNMLAASRIPPPSASGASSSEQPQAGPSASSSRPPTSGASGVASTAASDYDSVLGLNVSELPEGVDPSFLAALPEDMRQEVIEEQRRLQNIRQRAAQHVEAGVQEVNPEFLAALPPSIQEEVLAQQRLEQQRQAAASANPEAPVDPGEFLQTLPASLRQTVLADMEDSQVSALPAELAAEAQNLRREFEIRNRAMMHERFFNHVQNSGTSALSSILRSTVNRLGSQYVIGNMGGGGGGSRDNWRSTFPRPGQPGYPTSLLSTNLRFRGRQLLDHEGLSCLLILLFIDDSKISTTRLHRILRNLCYHAPTRDWVVSSLLSILEKSNDGKLTDQQALVAAASTSSGGEMPPAKIRKSASKSSAVGEKEKPSPAGASSPATTTSAAAAADGRAPSWLNISMDAALGFRANVFQVNRSAMSGGKKSSAAAGANADSRANAIGIHPGASTVVCRHTLEVLISLAKSFPGHFLPWRDLDKPAPPAVSAVEPDPSTGAIKKQPPSHTSTPAGKGESSKKNTAAAAAAESNNPPEFWDTLLKLDLQSSSKKGKSVARSHSTASSFKMDDDDSNSVPFDASPFGQLLSMLSSPVIRRNSVLTDKLLRLLSLISVGQPDILKKDTTAATTVTDGAGSPSAASPPSSIRAEHLKLAVEVLTSKACSEEGLEDVNSLLLNLSYGPEGTRDLILQLLLQGAQELGNVVRTHVLELQTELRQLKETAAAASGGEEASTSAEADAKAQKGVLLDRFTNQGVVLNAPSKVKGGSELQLPSMNALTNKTSSQAFFLRVLKVIIQLREAALLALKKKKAAKAKEAEQAAKEAQMKKDDTAAAGSASSTSATETKTKDEEKMEIDDPETGESSSSSSSGASAAKKQDSTESADEIEGLDSLSDQLSLEPLWEALSGCLKDLADTPDHHAVLVLQATVEAFFLVHAAVTQPDEKKKIQTKETRQESLAHIQESTEVLTLEKVMRLKAGGASSEPTSLATVPLSKDTEKFLHFAETHRTVLNQILRQSTVHLADGPFSVLVDHTRVLDFDIKRRYFRIELERMDDGLRREDLAVHVRRENVFEDSFRELHRRSPEEWKNRFYIVFEGEEGQDAGGLLREWYVIISREIFNPMYALFKTSPGDKVTYMIYEGSQTNPNHLDYFKFVGRVIAKAIYDNKLLECYFTRSFYKHILAKLVKYTDMESEDYTFYKSLAFLIDHKVEDIGYDLTFSTEIREFGVTEVRDLIKDGRDIVVTEDNKAEYVRLVCQMKMTGAIRKQLSAFLEGFYNIIPRRLISIFNEQELELLLSGLPTIDVDDLKAHTEYHKYQASSLQIVWFWRALRSFDSTDKAKFMQFVTGSSKVPLQGFEALEGMNGPQKFQIHRDDRSTDRLPSAHTCFNQLDLPAYETYDKLRSYLLKAVQECSEGFGFA